MPELPEVESFKRYIDSTALHHHITKVQTRSEKILKDVSAGTIRRRLKGQTMVKTVRHGKYLGVQLDSSDWLVLHFGMTGEPKYFKDESDTPKTARLLLTFENGYYFAYDCPRQLGQVRIVKDFDAFIEDQGLGRDALDPRVDLEWFREQVSERRGTLKGFLMNQEVIAGIGNEYADEILFQTRLDPAAKLESLGSGDTKRLFQTMKRVLKTCVKKNADHGRYPKTYLLPHRESDEMCPECGRNLSTKKMSGRTTYFCSYCQGD